MVPAPSTNLPPTGRVLSSAQSNKLKILKRRAAALQKVIDRTKNARAKKRLQDQMKIILKAIERTSK